MRYWRMEKTVHWAAMFVMLGVTMGTAENVTQLDMAPNSVDDIYDGCKDKMLEKVKGFLLNEKNRNRNFSLVWKEAEKYYDSKWNSNNGNNPFSPLTKEQIMAIIAYTFTKPKIYDEFNKAVRTQKKNYKTTFMYHTLHFFLTDALQTLNCRRSESQKCVTTYRRVNMLMKSPGKKAKFRFGSFTSSSLDDYPDPGQFGNKTCFKIDTCFGANISRYSRVVTEREVLIPPYEVFQVVGVDKRPKKKLKCELVYRVKSTKETKSGLNCVLI